MASICSYSTLNERAGKPLQLAYTVLKPTTHYDASSLDPIVFLHGLFGSQSNFRTIGRNVCDNLGRNVILMDLRNHGRSPHAPSMEYGSMASDVLYTLHNALRVNHASIIGHSMGGKVAAMAALQYPQTVSELVVVDIAPVTYTLMRDTMHVAQAMKHLDLQNGTIRTRQDADTALKDVVKDPVVRRFVLTNFISPQTPQGHASWRVNIHAILCEMGTLSEFPLKQGDATNTLTRSLFVHGTRSNYVLPAHNSVIHSFFPNAAFAKLDAGHWVHAERQQEFIDCITQFLSPQP
eukprot:gene3886-6376_t